jgi:hypothetical protein
MEGNDGEFLHQSGRLRDEYGLGISKGRAWILGGSSICDWGSTLLHSGVTHFATSNVRVFQNLGFEKV